MAHAESRAFMPTGAAAAPPPGFLDLCTRDESACGPARPLALASTAPSETPLRTSSLGGARATLPIVAAPPADAVGAIEAAPVQFEILTAWRPAEDADFLAAGQVRPLAPLPAPSPAQATAQLPAGAEAAVTVAALGKDKLRLINTINRDVNREVQKADDFDLYGLLEYWSLPRVINGKMYGDCEDYALEKRRRLIAAGVPAQALSMAVAVTARGEAHAVLVVAMEQGDMVLDNLTPWATPWQDLNYRWVERQVAGGSEWVSIG
ncbi:MAG: transglutaminase-like cysteine peptidase [Caulobacter sp.]|nr:transglutaminase-like cysteine peptidase [Caulobacter sp.]